MKKLLFSLPFLATALFAAHLHTGAPLKSLQAFRYEDPFKKKVTIADRTRLVLVSFERGTGDTAAAFLNAQSPDLLKRNNAVYIADIHRMPAIITYLFARPKMQKFTFPLYLYNQGDAFEKSVPHKEGKLTVIRFDEQQKIASISYIESSGELKELFAR